MATGAALAQSPFGLGLKAGVPLSDALSTSPGGAINYFQSTHRYTIGPYAEFRLPSGFSVELDALYRSYSFRQALSAAPTVSTGAWEFPLLAKYRFPGKFFRPFIDAGVSWDKLSGLTQTVRNAVSTGSVAELNNSTTRGFVMGAGLDVKVLLIHLSPEVRYTHWGSAHFIDPAGLISSKQNQAEFLLGITF